MNGFGNIEEMIDKFANTLPCQSDMPFPPIKVEKPNLEYAKMLYDAYSSSADSEIQAITQYIFHSKTINNKTVSNALMCIALVEMRHFDALGELIPLLGGEPFYYNSNKYFWTTGNIAYGDSSGKNEKESIREKLEKDIMGEQNAINGYKFILEHIKDKYLEKIILKIILDEQTHIKAFESLIQNNL